jgi:hypothetical protein
LGSFPEKTRLGTGVIYPRHTFRLSLRNKDAMMKQSTIEIMRSYELDNAHKQVPMTSFGLTLSHAT